VLSVDESRALASIARVLPRRIPANILVAIIIAMAAAYLSRFPAGIWLAVIIFVLLLPIWFQGSVRRYPAAPLTPRHRALMMALVFLSNAVMFFPSIYLFNVSSVAW